MVVYIALFTLVLYEFVMVKEHALFLFSSVFFGVLFLMGAYHCASKLRQDAEESPKGWVKGRYVVEMVLFLVLGLFNFVAPEHTLESYALSVGVILLLDGISRIVESRRGL